MRTKEGTDPVYAVAESVLQGIDLWNAGFYKEAEVLFYEARLDSEELGGPGGLRAAYFIRYFLDVLKDWKH